MAITRLGGANAITGTIPQGNIANASLGAVTALPAAIPTGKVLQVVQGSTTSSVSSTSSSYADTNLSASITPSSSSNKILVLVNQLIYHDNNDGADENYGLLKILRGSTAIFTTPSSSDLRITAEAASNNELRFGNRVSFDVLDTPSTTSATTYKTQFAKESGVQVIANKSSSKGFITLMEIAG